VRTPFGIKVAQDSNAYEYHLPKGLGALAWAIFRPASECKNSPARTDIDRKKEAADEEVQGKCKEEAEHHQDHYHDGNGDQCRYDPKTRLAAPQRPGDGFTRRRT
jgi:hypothetical protein